MARTTVVTNASPLIHLARIGRLDALPELYEEIYCPEAVKEEVKYPDSAVDFIEDVIDVRKVKNRNLIEEIQRAHPRLSLGEIETYILYRELGTDEALFLNTRAQSVFSHGYKGNIRDVINLPELDTKRRVFQTPQDEINFYLELERIIPGYRPLQRILRKRGVK